MSCASHSLKASQVARKTEIRPSLKQVLVRAGSSEKICADLVETECKHKRWNEDNINANEAVYEICPWVKKAPGF